MPIALNKATVARPGDRQRQDDLEQRAPFAGAIHPGRFDDLIGHIRFIEGAHDNHPEWAESGRQEEGPQRVLDLQNLPRHHVVSNQPAAKQHGEEGIEGKEAFELEIVP